MFITFEGLDGCGKTTQSKLLSDRLVDAFGEEKVLLTSELGGTELGQWVRGELSKPGRIPVSDFFLINGVRQLHWERVIAPALETETTVICDRYIDSTFVYQGRLCDNACPDILMNMMYEWFLLPDMTFFLTSSNPSGGDDHFEMMLRDEAKRAAGVSAYHSLFERFKNRMIKIPGAGEVRIDETSELIWEKYSEKAG